MRKGFIPPLILITVPILIISGVAYLNSVKKTQTQITSPNTQATPTPDPYRGWKTYKNNTYGFTIRYPREWHVLEYQDYAANFYDTDPKEATPGAIKVRFLRSQEKADLAEFEKIYNAKNSQEIREYLDVKSIITKIRNLEIAGNSEVEYEINRNFSALEGPKTEYSHVYEIDKEGTILKFISSDQTKELQQQFDPIFVQMIKSLKF